MLLTPHYIPNINLNNYFTRNFLQMHYSSTSKSWEIHDRHHNILFGGNKNSLAYPKYCAWSVCRM